jgi:hypothetical protein
MSGRSLFRKRNVIDTWRHVEIRRDSDLRKQVLTCVSVGFCAQCGAEKFIDPGESGSWICECGSLLKYYFSRPWEYAFLRLKLEEGTPEYIGQEQLDELGLRGWEAYSVIPVEQGSPEDGVTVLVALKRVYPLLHDFG